MKLFMFIFSVSVLSLTSCAPLKIQSTPTKHPVTIDGKFDDWADISMYYNDTPPFMVGAVNDSVQITLAVIFRDPVWAQLLLRRGFSVWLDKDKNFRIDYMGNLGALNKKKDFTSSEATPLRNKNRFRSLNSRDFTAITKQPESYISLREIEYLDAAFSFENGNYCLELQIPFKKTGKSFGIPLLSGKRVEVELVTKEAKNRQANRYPDMKPSGLRGGGGGRGNGYGKGKNRMASPRETGMRIKAVIQLAH